MGSRNTEGNHIAAAEESGKTKGQGGDQDRKQNSSKAKTRRMQWLGKGPLKQMGLGMFWGGRVKGLSARTLGPSCPGWTLSPARVALD